MLPVAVGNGERLKQPRRNLVGSLVPLALVAGPHIFAHCLLHLGPIEVSLQAFQGAKRRGQRGCGKEYERKLLDRRHLVGRGGHR
ncbi:hypothetical protein HaLaN_29952 [Haematococcus lacustris]|uniref:Uncharacterized protein n=1 Tax=Haematococcus lacustris TaxID=44745 RepID=A0A6A0AGL4_HAELA|nr:hypothetical protein HaLaN_29952 [Haematococcus lacustris]